MKKNLVLDCISFDSEIKRFLEEGGRGREDNLRNKKLILLILIIIILVSLFLISANIINLYLKDNYKVKVQTKEEVNKSQREGKIQKIEKNGQGSDRLILKNREKFTKTDIANLTNEIAKLNGFYLLGEPEIGMRDPNLIFKGEKIILPNGKNLIAEKNDAIWNYSIDILNRNYDEVNEKIIEFNQKISKFKKRIVDNIQELSIIKKEIEAFIKNVYIKEQKKVLEDLIKEVNVIPVR